MVLLLNTGSAAPLNLNADVVLQKKRSESGSDVLDPLDKLYVVHVQHSDKKAERKERWDAGGPLLPSLATALANFPHKVVELEKDSVCPTSITGCGVNSCHASPLPPE